jgi:putative transposase
LAQDRAADGHREGRVLAFAAFPRAHWRKMWSTNHIERINKQI